MTEEQWTAAEDYFASLYAPPDPALDEALESSSAAGLPEISVSANQGKLLQVLAQAIGANAILELGTLGGYSSIWLARALPPGGRLVTLEADPHHAAVARDNIARAGLAGAVEVRTGAALDTLPQLAAEGRGPFDLVFIDADKPSYPDYLAWALKLTHKGSLIVADNVVSRGAVADAGSADPDVLAKRRFHELLAGEKGVTAAAVQTVGAKGYDGFCLALVTGDPS